mmetsp:Transcript_13566/g.34118  ORF Transcript_13566/g.34118 Transcript_13566/m.34118 type:complete len:95 (-) Transcript_13566:40-324(-)
MPGWTDVRRRHRRRPIHHYSDKTTKGGISKTFPFERSYRLLWYRCQQKILKQLQVHAKMVGRVAERQGSDWDYFVPAHSEESFHDGFDDENNVS